MSKIPAGPDVEPGIFVVAYASKSSPDEKNSTGDQVEKIAARVGDLGNREIVGQYSEEAVSGYLSDRGPELERAMAAAVELAASGKATEFWIFHSSRPARGSGRKDEARSLLEVFTYLRRHGVTLRSVTDDEYVGDEAFIGMASKLAHQHSKDKSAHVTRGKEQTARAGRYPGGIPCDGYRVIRDVDAHGRIIRRAEFDPQRFEIYRLLWDLALAGYSAEAITLELDSRGYMTKPYKKSHKPRPIDANRVRQTLDNPFYAGLSVYKGEVVAAGEWPRYIEPEDFYRLRDQRRERCHATKRQPGRPRQGYVLAHGLGRCAVCGSTTDAITGRYVRQDGSVKRNYECRAHREHPVGHSARCTAEVFNAATVDAAILDHLPHLLGDVDGLRAQFLAARSAERDRLEGEVERARQEAEECERVVARMTAKYDALVATDDEAKAEAVLDAITRRRDEWKRVQARADAALDALAAAGEANESDDEGEFIERIRSEILTRVTDARDDIKRLNVTLREFFEAFELSHTEEGIRVVPVLSEAAAARILRDIDRWPHGVSATVAGRRAAIVGMTDDGDVVLFVPVKRSEADAFETAAMDAGEAVIDVRGPDAIDLPESPSAFENTLVGCRASACSKANSFADSTTGRSPTRTDRVAGSNASSPTTRAPAAARPSARRSTARTRAWSSA